MEKYLTKKELSMDELFCLQQNYEEITEDIKENVDDIFDVYLNIGSQLIKAEETKCYFAGEYPDLYSYCLNEFQLSKTTVFNLMSIIKRFTEFDNEDYIVKKIKDEYSGFNYSQLVELLSVPEDSLLTYTPELSVVKIRENKAKEKYMKLVDDFEKQIILQMANHDTFGSFKFKLDLRWSSSRKLIFTKKNIELEFITFCKYNKKHSIEFRLYCGYDYIYSNSLSSLDELAGVIEKLDIELSCYLEKTALEKKENKLLKDKNKDQWFIDLKKQWSTILDGLDIDVVFDKNSDSVKKAKNYSDYKNLLGSYSYACVLYGTISFIIASKIAISIEDETVMISILNHNWIELDDRFYKQYYLNKHVSWDLVFERDYFNIESRYEDKEE